MRNPRTSPDFGEGESILWSETEAVSWTHVRCNVHGETLVQGDHETCPGCEATGEAYLALIEHQAPMFYQAHKDNWPERG